MVEKVHRIMCAENVIPHVIQFNIGTMEKIIMMSESMKANLKHLVVEHEGFEQFPYTDTVGKITIGIGYNLSDRGMSNEWINSQYDIDVNYFYSQLNDNFHWFKNLNEARQIALIDMCFMGFKKLCEFKKMLAALELGNYKEASAQMLHSKWAAQVKGRAVTLAKMIETGEML